MHMTLVVTVLPVRVPVRARALSYSLSPPPPRLCTNILLQLLQLVVTKYTSASVPPGPT